jgi:hypothetical protein
MIIVGVFLLGFVCKRDTCAAQSAPRISMGILRGKGRELPADKIYLFFVDAYERGFIRCAPSSNCARVNPITF